ncbi:MAG: DUF1573 domain-containing protein [Saprospiraceae bacterium]|nr:DUF1573 domain-containing protein [Saprospiraceae bacterium]
MNRILLVLALVVSTMTVTFAQNDASAEQAQETTTSGPQMVFEAETVDYGVIEQNADPYRFFKFTNTGDAPLVIKHAKGSCGCTVPTYPKEPIAPGESAEIKVRYDTKRIGKFTKRVTLTTNIEGEKQVLTIKGEVKRPAEEPDAIPSSNSGFNN